MQHKNKICIVSLIALSGLCSVASANVESLPPAKIPATSTASLPAFGGLPLPPVPDAKSIAPALSSAPTLDASFAHGLPLSEFARVVLEDVLHAPFIFSNDFLASTDRVGFSASQLKRQGSEKLLRDVLFDRGFSLERKDGYFRINKIEVRESDKEDFLYRPRFRSIGYLSSVLRPLFPAGSFSFERSFAGSTNTAGSFQTTNVGGSTSTTTSGQSSGSQKPVDNGTSAYSQQTNTDIDMFVFRGTHDAVRRLRDLLKQVDVESNRVLVRAIVIEVSKSKNSTSAIQLVASALSSKLSLTIGGSTLADNHLTFQSPDFKAVFSALSADSSFKVVTSPSVYVQSGASGYLAVGDSVPTLGSISYDTNGQSHQSVSYVDTGTILRVNPSIYEESIDVTLSQQISNAVNTTSGVAGTPTLTKRELSSTFPMRVGEWTILGGLTGSQTTRGTDRLPFFNFKIGSNSSDTETEIVILLNTVKG